MTPGRIAVCRAIGSKPDGAYLSDIIDITGIPIGSMRGHLKPLEAHGAISGDIPFERRKGRSVKYTLNAERILEAFDKTKTYLIA